MQKIIDYLTWGFILLFAAPTILIMASWNSLPGEPIFGVKRSFEQVLLFFVKPSYAAEAGLNVQYTQRRFNEAKVLLASNQSTQGLSYLSQQIKATKTVIERAPNKAKQREVAQNYIATLRTVSEELEVQQQAMGPQQGSVPSGLSQNQPTRLPTATPKPGAPPQPTPTPSPQPSPEEELEEIQEEIDDTIEDLEELSLQADMPSDDDDNDENNNDNNQGSGNGNKDKKKEDKQDDHGKGNND